MIESSNSITINTAQLRGGAEQVSSAQSLMSKISTQPVSDAPKAPYISPYIALDYNYDRAVLQIRDSETGDVVQQFPTESRLAELRRSQQALEIESLRSVVPDAAPVQDRSQNIDALSAAESNIAPQVNIASVQESSVSSAPKSAPPAHVAVAALAATSQAGKAPTTTSVSVLA